MSRITGIRLAEILLIRAVRAVRIKRLKHFIPYLAATLPMTKTNNDERHSSL